MVSMMLKVLDESGAKMIKPNQVDLESIRKRIIPPMVTFKAVLPKLGTAVVHIDYSRRSGEARVRVHDAGRPVKISKLPFSGQHSLTTTNHHMMEKLLRELVNGQLWQPETATVSTN